MTFAQFTWYESQRDIEASPSANANMNLGNPNAAPVIKAEHDRMRTRSVVDGNGSRPFN